MGTLALLSAIFGGGSLVTLITFLITRKDQQKKEQSEVLQEVKSIRAEMRQGLSDVRTEIQEVRAETAKIKEENAEDRAITYRVRILRFEDELQEGKNPSKDSFDQVLDDISRYNKYCTEHPEFKNDQTVLTVEHIRSVYKEKLDNQDFLVRATQTK